MSDQYFQITQNSTTTSLPTKEIFEKYVPPALTTNLIVHLTGYTTALTADKSFIDITSAVESARNVIVEYQPTTDSIIHYYRLTDASSSTIYFAKDEPSIANPILYLTLTTLSNVDTWTFSSMTPILYGLMSVSSPYTCSLTYDQIKTALGTGGGTGQQVILRHQPSSNITHYYHFDYYNSTSQAYHFKYEDMENRKIKSFCIYQGSTGGVWSYTEMDIPKPFIVNVLDITAAPVSGQNYTIDQNIQTIYEHNQAKEEVWLRYDYTVSGSGTYSRIYQLIEATKYSNSATTPWYKVVFSRTTQTGSETFTIDLTVGTTTQLNFQSKYETDYVVSQAGSTTVSNSTWNGNYEYIKWNSGRMEMWLTVNVGTVGTDKWQAWGNIYEAEIIKQGSEITWPVAFTSIPRIMVTSQSQTAVIWAKTSNPTATKSGHIWLCCAGNVARPEVYIQIQAVGKWK